MPRVTQRINVAAALIIGADFVMMLTALTLVLPPASYAWPVLAPHVAAALVMVVFGPYLLAVSSCGILGRGGYSPDQHFFPKYVDGRYTLANGSEMLVSRGLARESTPLPRLFNPPEIMVVELMGRARRGAVQVEEIVLTRKWSLK